MQTAIINHANAMHGLFKPGTEFVAVDKNTLRTFHANREIGGEIRFEELPEREFNTIRKKMGDPNATIEEMKAFCIGHWGGIDGEADIDENGIPGKAEYVEGISNAYYDNGERISDAQLRVLKLIHLDDKAIAEKLFLSRFTVARHCADIYANLGVDENQGNNKRAIAAQWVKDKGIN
jgi:hypothetical protein